MQAGGEVLETRGTPASIAVQCARFGDAHVDFRSLREAFSEHLDNFGPDAFFQLQRALYEARETLTLPGLLSIFRAGRWDGQALLLFYERLKDLLRAGPVRDSEAFLEGFRRMWDQHLEIGDERDLAYHLGVASCLAGGHEQALEFYARSTALFGADAHVAYNQALCLFHLGRIPEALAQAERSRDLDPAQDGIHDLIADLRAPIAARPSDEKRSVPA
jgi:tetratricopeptide (TPR) repeat protein